MSPGRIADYSKGVASASLYVRTFRKLDRWHDHRRRYNVNIYNVAFVINPLIGIIVLKIKIKGVQKLTQDLNLPSFVQ